MKLLLLSALAIFPLALRAQTLEASGRPRTYVVGNTQAPIYSSIADTAKPFPLLLSPGTSVTTVGEYNARWVKLELKGRYYLIQNSMLAGYPPRVMKAKAVKVKDNEATPVLPIDAESHLVDYTGVVEIPASTQDQLYTRAFEWVAKQYPAAGNALVDKEKGRITVQGTTHPRYNGNEFGTVSHTFTIYVKNGKYKYDFTNFRHDYRGAGAQGGDASLGPFENETPRKMVMMSGLLHRVWNSIRNDTDSQIKALIADLDHYMKGQTKDKSDF
jgi:hypothetical protein